MNAVLYYSNTNESLHIAEYFRNLFHFEILDIRKITSYSFQHVVIVFPVYSQNIPTEVRNQLRKIKADKVILVATYGKMSYGRVLYDAQRLIEGAVVGAAYIPTKHSYLIEDKAFDDYASLNKLKECFSMDKDIKIPKTKKNVFANVLINQRARIGIKILKNRNCSSCNICHQYCDSITNGRTDKTCIRCMKCISICPNQALSFKQNIFMKKYLSKTRCNKVIFYLN